MVVISKRAINEFIEMHPKSANALLNWYLKAKESDWANFADVKKVFGATDSVGSGLYVFNIGGNKYRLIARIIFKARTVFIRFIGTHAEYDKVKLSDL
ncbi:MAG TPA: type II toxin-antitoxin system HigB family toxin [Chitinophagaceae bacterium]|jgi:mRNA interferase HigB|nr:type II toxin-antitoxin system HigB family toxin [Chitinophagaceae bacterium]